MTAQIIYLAMERVEREQREVAGDSQDLTFTDYITLVLEKRDEALLEH